LWQIFTNWFKLAESSNVLVHRFGCFCLANLTHLDLNRNLMADFADKVICLQWSHDEQARIYGKEIAKNFGYSTVPKLVSMASVYVTTRGMK